MNTSPRGFVALVSAVIFSLLLMMLVLSESSSAFWTRYNQTDNESKSASMALADSCMYKALLNYAEDPDSVSKSQIVDFDSRGTCTIDAVLTDNATVTFSTYSVVDAVPVILIVTATTNSGNLDITSWKTSTSIPP